MRKERRQLSVSFKAKVALEALQEKKTISQIATEYDLHPNQVGSWRKELLEGSSKIFESTKPIVDKAEEKLYRWSQPMDRDERIL